MAAAIKLYRQQIWDLERRNKNDEGRVDREPGANSEKTQKRISKNENIIEGLKAKILYEQQIWDLESRNKNDEGRVDREPGANSEKTQKRISKNKNIIEGLKAKIADEEDAEAEDAQLRREQLLAKIRGVDVDDVRQDYGSLSSRVEGGGYFREKRLAKEKEKRSKLYDPAKLHAMHSGRLDRGLSHSNLATAALDHSAWDPLLNIDPKARKDATIGDRAGYESSEAVSNQLIEDYNNEMNLLDKEITNNLVLEDKTRNDLLDSYEFNDPDEDLDEPGLLKWAKENEDRANKGHELYKQNLYDLQESLAKILYLETVLVEMASKMDHPPTNGPDFIANEIQKLYVAKEAYTAQKFTEVVVRMGQTKKKMALQQADDHKECMAAATPGADEVKFAKEELVDAKNELSRARKREKIMAKSHSMMEDSLDELRNAKNQVDLENEALLDYVKEWDPAQKKSWWQKAKQSFKKRRRPDKVGGYKKRKSSKKTIKTGKSIKRKSSMKQIKSIKRKSNKRKSIKKKKLSKRINSRKKLSSSK